MTAIPAGRTIDLEQLQDELVAAGVPLPNGLVIDGPDIYRLAGNGRLQDLPPVALAIITAHVPTDPRRDRVLALAQTAVGVALDALTAAQRNALLAVLLYKAGGLDRATMQVKPLNQWVR